MIVIIHCDFAVGTFLRFHAASHFLWFASSGRTPQKITVDHSFIPIQLNSRFCIFNSSLLIWNAIDSASNQYYVERFIILATNEQG